MAHGKKREPTFETCDAPRAYKWKRSLCTCEQCFIASRKEQKRGQVRRDLGLVKNSVNASVARKRLKSLITVHGLTVRQISDYTGYSREQLQKIKKPHGKHYPRNVRGDLYEKLGEMIEQHRQTKPPKTRRTKRTVDPDRAQRAVHALMYQGYPQGWISDRLNEMIEKDGKSTESYVSTICRGSYGQVLKTVDDALVQLVRDVGLKQGPSARVAAIARRRGYKPAMAWDDFM